MFGLVKRLWIPLLLVVVIALGAYVVVRVRDSFGAGARIAASDANADDTKPFNPKHITYELTAPAGGTVSVNFLDENGQPHLVEDAPLPWSHTIVTTLPSMSANIVAQGDAGMRQLRCRIIVDDDVRDDRSIDEYKPFIYCLVKSV
ncbi:MmpS family transport accessory protein [Mycolicibacter longobardus]|uniref:MmpS family transport accessory protein n=1 Tax=Mycolicibacter longobardus TaxID=1108812 RepID=UPI000D6A72B7|nr:MmpS family transport accessory protein [Mycolicibacter longobardus]